MNMKCKISDLKHALELFEQEHGNLQVVLAFPDPTSLERVGFETVEIVDKFSISQGKVGKKKVLILTEMFK